MASRKSYTLAYKQFFLISLDDNDGNITKTAKQHQLTRTHIQRWKKDKDLINQACSPKRKREGSPEFVSSSPMTSARKRRRIRYDLFVIYKNVNTKQISLPSIYNELIIKLYDHKIIFQMTIKYFLKIYVKVQKLYF